MGKLVANPVEYRYCSAFPGFKLDAWPPAAKAVESVGAKTARLKVVPFPFVPHVNRKPTIPNKPRSA